MESTPSVDLHAWIGRTETLHDVVTPTPVAAFKATLDHSRMALAPGAPSAEGAAVHPWASDHEGWLTTDATVELR